MSRRTGQIIALFAVIVLTIAAVWYQVRQDSSLRTQLLGGNYGYPVGYGGTGGGGVSTTTTDPASFDSNAPQSTAEQNGIAVLNYLVPFNELTVLDGLQVPLHVPSLSSPVLWEQESTNGVSVVIDDEMASRTAFLSPEEETMLSFLLKVPDANGDYETVAQYVFAVVSPLAYAADVNKDGHYDFQNDLVNLLRNWDSFGDDATRTLALILSRLEE